MEKVIKKDLGQVVGEVNAGTLIPYDSPEDYTVPMSGDSIAAFMGKVTTDLGIHDNVIRRPDKFDEDVSYIVGDYCIRENIMYKFTDAKEPGAWEPEKVIETNIKTELEDLYKKVDELNGNINSSIVLWENPEPTASFAAQDITLTTDDYDEYEVFYTSRTDGTLQSQKSIKGYGVNLIGVLAAGSAAVFMRPIKYVSDTKFAVSKTTYSTTSGPNTANEYLLPIRIIGYK